MGNLLFVRDANDYRERHLRKRERKIRGEMPEFLRTLITESGETASADGDQSTLPFWGRWSLFRRR